jgi:hypothetical protein
MKEGCRSIFNDINQKRRENSYESHIAAVNEYGNRFIVEIGSV